MLHELERERTIEFVRGWFRQKTDYLLREEIADRAETLAHNYAREGHGFVSPLSMITVESAWHATLLVDAISKHGHSFEELAELTNLEAAGMVASITPDLRLPAPRRILAHISDLGQASRYAQIIRLVYLRGELEDATRKFVANPEGSRSWLKEWLPGVSEYVGALWRCGKHTSLYDEFRRVQLMVHDMTEALDRWQLRFRVLDRLEARLAQEAAEPPAKKAKRAPSMKSPGGNSLGREHPWAKDGPKSKEVKKAPPKKKKTVTKPVKKATRKKK